MWGVEGWQYLTADEHKGIVGLRNRLCDGLRYEVIIYVRLWKSVGGPFVLIALGRRNEWHRLSFDSFENPAERFSVAVVLGFEMARRLL